LGEKLKNLPLDAERKMPSALCYTLLCSDLRELGIVAATADA